MAWLSGWDYRKQITISTPSGVDAGTNYQIPLMIGESSGASNYDFHIEGHSELFPTGENDSGDLAFTTDDGNTEIDFWVEDVIGTTPNRTVRVWVEVSDQLNQDRNIYCYYGNGSSGLANKSNGDNTFLSFHDFETDPNIITDDLSQRAYHIGDFNLSSISQYKVGFRYNITNLTTSNYGTGFTANLLTPTTNGNNYFQWTNDTDLTGVLPASKVNGGSYSQLTTGEERRCLFTRDDNGNLKIYDNESLISSSSSGDSTDYNEFYFNLYSGGDTQSTFSYNAGNKTIDLVSKRPSSTFEVSFYNIFLAKHIENEPSFSSAEAEEPFSDTINITDDKYLKFSKNLSDIIYITDDIFTFAGHRVFLSDTITITDDPFVNIPLEVVKFTENLIYLSDEIYTNVPVEKVFLEDTISLGDFKQANYPQNGSRLIWAETNVLLIACDDNPAKIIKVDVSGATPVHEIRELDDAGEEYRNAIDLALNDLTNYFYVSCGEGKVAKINYNDLSERMELNVNDSDDLTYIDTKPEIATTYVSTDHNQAELYMLYEGDFEVLNTDFRYFVQQRSTLNTHFSYLFGTQINTDLRYLVQTETQLKTDFRFLTSVYSELEPISREDFVVKINGTEVPDVNLSAIVVYLTADDDSRATFELARKHDNLDQTLDGTSSEITDNNPVEILLNDKSIFTGFIRSLDCSGSEEKVTVTAKGEEYDRTDTEIKLSLPSVNESLHLYHILLDEITIDNPVIDPDDDNPEYYKGVTVDLGTREMEAIYRQEVTLSMTASEFEEFEPDPNYTYFWYVSGRNLVTGWSFSNVYIGTSLTSLSSDTYIIESVTYKRQRKFNSLFTELGTYTLGEAPYQEVSVKNGQFIGQVYWEDREDGLYEVYPDVYTYYTYAQAVADVEYSKLLNINGDILPRTSASINLTLDAFLYYDLKLLHRINIVNTTESNIYNENNGFPLSIKNMTIDSSSMRVSVTLNNELASSEMDELDETLPDEPTSSGEFSFFQDAKYDLNKEGIIT